MRNYGAFADELEKYAALPAISALLKNRGAMATATAAGMGGLWRGQAGYDEAAEQGKGFGGRALGALRHGAMGAAGGAALGAGVATGAKHLGGRPGRYMQGAQKSLYNLGGQQAHALTGVGSAAQFGGGTAISSAAKTQAMANLKKMREGAARNPNAWRGRLSRAQKAVDRTTRGHEWQLQAEKMGITSLPGTIKAIRERGVSPVLRTAWHSQVSGMGPGGKALMFGVPAGMAVAGAAGAKPGERGEAIGESAGLAASNVLPMAMSPSMLGALGPGASLMPTWLMSRPFMYAGKQVGRGADWAVNRLRGGGEQ